MAYKEAKRRSKKIDVICDSRLGRYFSITEEAFSVASKNVFPDKKVEASQILDMVSRYISDAKHFKSEGHYVNAFAALNYAYGWLDTGSKLGIFDVSDNRLFVTKE